MKILFLGGDERMLFVRERLSADYDIAHNGGAEVVILPMPLTKDGKNIFSPTEPIAFEHVGAVAKHGALVLAGGECPALAEVCKLHGLHLVNYALDEWLTLRNAALTAESAVVLLAQSTKGALLGSRVLITGYGRIAKQLATRLRAMGCAVTIAARRSEALCEAELNGLNALPLTEVNDFPYDFIVNTVPSRLFTDFVAMGNAVYLELATLAAPEHTAEVLYIHGGGLPGKHSPKAAGEYIAATLLRILNERNEQT